MSDTTMKQITLTQEQTDAAAKLGLGPVVFAYQDGTAVRMEVENGDDPYVWRDGGWAPMRQPA